MQLWLQDDLLSRKVLLQRALVFSAVTLFVLFLFQPFGTHNDPMSYKFLRLSGYSLVTFCALLLSGALEIGLTRLKVRRPFRSLLIPSLYIGTVAVFNHSYFVVAILGSWHWQNQLLFVFYTLAIGLFPMCFMFLVHRHSVTISPPQPIDLVVPQTDGNHTTQVKPIILRGDNKDDNVYLALSQLLFIKSADNYCELALVDGVSCSRTLLRCSLTNLLKQLPKDAQMYRCHRSYAVNLLLVDSWQGNAAGLQLSMGSGDVVVPVSRSYVEVIKQALSLVPKAC